MTSLQALAPVLALCVNCAAQVLLFRRAGALLRSVYLGFFSGLAACALLCGFSAELPPGLITYGALGYCYFHFINLGETARRIRIVRELSEAGPAGLSKEELLGRYDARNILDARLARLVNNAQIIKKDGRYCLGKPAVLYMARALLLMKKLLLGRSAESL
ncbi:MAG: hypothetical protein HY550_00555 [Elusimicrobia bacterium]|nr:hypothetical protein [Elusimicrobiota bacterium]